MYKGRHCLPIDYQLLEKTTLEFLLIINRDNFDVNEVDIQIDTFSDFDSNIASKIRMYLEKNEVDKTAIKELLNELKNNVLVDIREHN